MTALCLALVLTAQPPAAADPDPLERFRRLSPERRTDVVRLLERRVLLDPDPTIQRIVSKARSFSSYPIEPPRRAFDPERWAPGVAPARRRVPKGSAQWLEVRRRIPPVEALPGLHAAIRYDWAGGRVVRRAERLTPTEVFANALSGHPPGTDAALAHVLAELDRDASIRPLAEYFEHLYADLRGRVYENVTLYEAWYSGEVVDVPDVDAIPFAVRILKTRAYRSPIPRGPRRTALYSRIRDAAFALRRYRTLREAAAAVFVHPDPPIDPTYRPLVSRLHYLWAKLEEDTARLAARLAETPDRGRLLRELDQEMQKESSAFERAAARKERLRAAAQRVRAAAIASLDGPR